MRSREVERHWSILSLILFALGYCVRSCLQLRYLWAISRSLKFIYTWKVAEMQPVNQAMDVAKFALFNSQLPMELTPGISLRLQLQLAICREFNDDLYMTQDRWAWWSWCMTLGCCDDSQSKKAATAVLRNVFNDNKGFCTSYHHEHLHVHGSDISRILLTLAGHVNITVKGFEVGLVKQAAMIRRRCTMPQSRSTTPWWTQPRSLHEELVAYCHERAGCLSEQLLVKTKMLRSKPSDSWMAAPLAQAEW